MTQLSKNWIIEPVFDYEYKTYQALEYSTFAERSFAERKLFPYLTDLKKHIDLLTYYRSSVLELENGIRTPLLGVHPETFELIYRRPNEDEVSEFLKEVISFALEKFMPVYEQGLSEKKQVNQNIRVSPVGLVLPDTPGGLLFLERYRKTRVYRFRFRMVRRAMKEEVYKDVKTDFVEELDTGMFPNYANLKLEYLKNMGQKQQMNTYLIETDADIPTFETVMPMVKEYLISRNP